MQRPTCVIDNGTGYTKMGYAGNAEPRCADLVDVCQVGSVYSVLSGFYRQLETVTFQSIPYWARVLTDLPPFSLCAV